MKVWKYGMIPYVIQILNPKYQFFSRLTKFQQCMFKRIHWIRTSTDGPTNVAYNRSLYVKVHCVVIEYENEKAKLAHYLVQLIDLDDHND